MEKKYFIDTFYGGRYIGDGDLVIAEMEYKYELTHYAGEALMMLIKGDHPVTLMTLDSFKEEFYACDIEVAE